MDDYADFGLPAIATTWDGDISIWDPRDLAARKKVFSIPLPDKKIELLTVSPSRESMFVIVLHNDQVQLRQLDLSVTKAASNACHRGAGDDATFWTEYFPDVAPFPLCP
ncbi:hypothetical protein [Nocardia sp. NRRL S-836]|uniref:hypothetical protein n=1 Tax=Nocardia sp. NRRL S-836 TaxID=1519492 RepID=UPI0006AFA7D2|nr:hypothetical protein [Nocardia sp. NRRL S-836]